MIKYRFVSIIIFVNLIFPGVVFAAEVVRVAVASNYIQTFKEISAIFVARTGIKIEASYTSSGNLYSQIVNGAPYDIFLSADEERPDRLYKAGKGEKPFIYAKGWVILWSARKEFCSTIDWKEAVKKEENKRISIINPEVAPYGKVAMAALKEARLWIPMQVKLSVAQTVPQAFQYASTEAVDACFCSLSSAMTDVGKKGCFYSIAEAPTVLQAACILKGKKSAETAKFVKFLLSPEANIIKKKYGYE